MDEGKQSLGEELQIAWSGRKSAVIPCAMARSDRRAWNRLLPVQDSPRASGLTTGGTASAQGTTYCTILLIRYYHTLLTYGANKEITRPIKLKKVLHQQCCQLTIAQVTGTL